MRSRTAALRVAPATQAGRQGGEHAATRFLRAEHEGDSGIVYCLSRRGVEETADFLRGEGFHALPYHAGLDAQTRRRHQAAFLRDDPIIMVATIAFGMGIDKPDVRFVAHLDLPKSVEGYYQETGRAGRDGLPSTAWLAYGLQDVVQQRQLIDRGDGDPAHKRRQSQLLDAMLALCETVECRRAQLLDYFGQQLPGAVGQRQGVRHRGRPQGLRGVRRRLGGLGRLQAQSAARQGQHDDGGQRRETVAGTGRGRGAHHARSCHELHRPPESVGWGQQGTVRRADATRKE